MASLPDVAVEAMAEAVRITLEVVCAVSEPVPAVIVADDRYSSAIA